VIDVSSISGRLLAKLAHGAGLKSGDIVKAQVLRHLSGQRYAVSIRGTVFPTRSLSPLSVGHSFRARVEITPTEVRLHPVPTLSSIDTVLRAHGLESDSARAVAHHLQTLGLPLDPVLIRRLTPFTHRDRPGVVRLRIAALLLDKGLDPNSDLTDDLVSLVLGNHSGTGHEGSDSRHDRDRRERADSTPPLVEEVEEADHPVQVFNHFKGKHGQWLMLPIAADSPEGRYAGTLQLFYPLTHGSYQRAVLTVGAPSSYWAFVWDNPALTAGARLRLYTDTHSADSRQYLAGLAGSLEPFGLTLNPEVFDDPEPATFSIFQSETIMTGVDKVV
jgi:hypothetical protein